MSNVKFKSIESLFRRKTLSGDEKIPVSGLEYVTTRDIANINDPLFYVDDDGYLATEEKGIRVAEVVSDSIHSEGFRPGGFAGAGAGLTRNANEQMTLEVDNIVVRRSLEVNEVLINQVSHVGGRTIFSAANMQCMRVVSGGTYWRCYFDTKNGQLANLWRVGDQAYCQRYSPDGTQMLKYYWRVVTSVGGDWINLSKSDCDGSDTPTEGDNIVQIGSRTDTARQAMMEIDQLHGGKVVQYAGIDSFNFVNRNEVAFGVNEQGRPFFYAYGDMFVGDRDLTDPDATFITFQTAEGESRPRLRVRADMEIGAGSSGLTNLSEWASKQQQIDTTNTKVDNLQIGGANLAVGTANIDVSITQTTPMTILSIPNLKNLNEGTAYMISFDAKYISGNGIIHCEFQGSMGGNVEVKKTGKYDRYGIEATLGSSSDKYLYFWLLNSGRVDIKKIKVEIGNKFTDWSPAPEDIQSQIDVVGAGVNNLQYLSNAFSKDNTVIAGGVVASSFVGVRDSAKNIIAGIAGKNFIKNTDFTSADKSCPMIFAGAPNAASANNAKFRVYPDGSAATSALLIEDGCKIGNFKMSDMNGFTGFFCQDAFTDTIWISNRFQMIRKRDNAAAVLGYSGSFVNSQHHPVGLYLKATSGDDAGIYINVGTNKPAIEIESGYIRGFRPDTKYVASTYSLTDFDNVIICRNQTQITLWLPPSPKNGQRYEIYKTNSSPIVIAGNGKLIVRAGLATAPNHTFGIEYYRWIFMSYCSETDEWYMT